MLTTIATYAVVYLVTVALAGVITSGMKISHNLPGYLKFFLVVLHGLASVYFLVAGVPVWLPVKLTKR